MLAKVLFKKDHFVLPSPSAPQVNPISLCPVDSHLLFLLSWGFLRALLSIRAISSRFSCFLARGCLRDFHPVTFGEFPLSFFAFSYSDVKFADEGIRW